VFPALLVCHYRAFVNAPIMAYQFAASRSPTPGRNQKEIEKYDDEYPTTT
jgi:hypothetical protein